MRISGFVSRFSVLGFRVSGFGFRVSGWRLRVEGAPAFQLVDGALEVDLHGLFILLGVLRCEGVGFRLRG